MSAKEGEHKVEHSPPHGQQGWDPSHDGKDDAHVETEQVGITEITEQRTVENLWEGLMMDSRQCFQHLFRTDTLLYAQGFEG